MSEHWIDPATTVAHAPLVPIIRLAATTTLAEATRVASRTGVGVLVVDTHPTTVVTRERLAHAIVAGADPDASISAITHVPEFVSAHDQLLDVVHAMAVRQCTDVLVRDETGELVGVLSLTEAVATLLAGPQWLGALRVALRIEATP